MGNCKMNPTVFEQIESVKKILSPIVSEGENFRRRGLILRCVKFKTGQVKKLSKEESMIYDLLLKNKLNPKTVYEWLLLENVPAHIKEKLVQKKISLNEARIQFVKWKRLSDTHAGNALMDEIKNIIRRLRWKSQEGLPKTY